MGRTKIQLQAKKIRIGDVDMDIKRHEKRWYEERVAELQLEMLRIQQAYYRQKRRAMLVFEGWDAGGKGGAIRRLTSRLDPRGVRVHAIGAPSREEQGKHYLYRFWNRLPKLGNIAVFDRSWYGRVLVERVEGFTDEAGWKRSFDEINEFERLLVDDGVRVVKFFLHVSKDEQLKRFEERLQDPFKRWKLTADDFRNRDKWEAYERAIDEMFAKTSTTFAPWNAIAGNYKWHARTSVLELAAAALGDGVDLSEPIADPEVVDLAHREYGFGLARDPDRSEPEETTKVEGNDGKGKKGKGKKGKKPKGKKGKKPKGKKGKKGKGKGKKPS